MAAITLLYKKRKGALFAHVMKLFCSIDAYRMIGVIRDDDQLCIDDSVQVRKRTHELFSNLFSLPPRGEIVFPVHLRRRFVRVREFYESGCRDVYREIFKKYFKINPNINSRVDELANQFKGNVLGVHVRLTDMNYIHRDTGNIQFDDYLKYIELIREKRKIDTIFVASDNHVSINKLKSRFPDLLYHESFIRSDKEILFGWNPVERDNLNNIEFQCQSMVESVTLSKCDIVLGRASNLFNACHIWGNPDSYQIIADRSLDEIR